MISTPVPEAAVDEYGEPKSREHQVGAYRPRSVETNRMINSKTQPGPM